MSKTRLDRFWEKVEKRDPDQCWTWTASLYGGGYGHFWDGYHVAAHVFSWLIHRGKIPSGMCVLHECDNRKCVNPSHLFLGDHPINMNDMAAKGRSAKGIDNGRAKLNAAKVRKIRKMRQQGMAMSKIADLLDVADNCVWQVVHRKTWGFVK